MKCRILLILMIVVLCILSFGAICASAATYGDFTYYVSNGTVTITKYGASATTIEIPSQIDGYPVTSIDYSAFLNRIELTSITIPESVITIGGSAFSGCTSLTDIEIPNGVTSIGHAAFRNCTSLTSIEIPDSVTLIGDEAFCGCTNLSNIVIPDKVISIGGDAFSDTAYYNWRYNWDNSGLYIGKHLIKGVSSSYNGGNRIKDGTLTIAGSAYSWMENLTSIIIADSVTAIGSYAFSGCTSLTSIEIPDGVTSIGDYAFRNCTSLTSIEIPDSVTSIGDEVFRDCTSLISIEISNNITSIGHYMFYDCKSLTDIEIPNSVTSIGYAAFYDCTSLTSVGIPDSVTAIGSFAFSGCTGLRSMEIPDGITSIENYAFRNCTSLTNIEIPDSVISIGNYAFYDCYILTSVKIPDTVTSIGDDAFCDCRNLVNVYYNGTGDMWDDIVIGSRNTPLTDATRYYIAYVTLFDINGNYFSKTMHEMGKTIDMSKITVPTGYMAVLYKDNALGKMHDINTPINENITLYIDFIKPNSIEIRGDLSADMGEKGIIQKVSFVTDKTVKHFVCTLKYSNTLSLANVASKDFEIEQDKETVGGYTYLYLTCTYYTGDNMPVYTLLTPFELVFDISEDAVANDILTVEILDDAVLANSSGDVYTFESIGKAAIKINPILAEEIVILGPNEIDSPTTYSVSVFPENTTNKDVKWSVSDETIATISQNGVLTPVKNGEVILKATTNDESGIYAEKTVCFINVLAKIEKISTSAGVWNKNYTSEENEYIIYVPKTTTSIKLTVEYSGTLESEDGKTFINNVGKNIVLSSDETNLTLNYSFDGCDDNTYTITIIKFEGTKTNISDNNKIFAVNPINIANGRTVILALFDGEIFVETQTATYKGEEIIFVTDKDYSNAKVMVWENMTSLKPVCDVEIVK